MSRAIASVLAVFFVAVWTATAAAKSPPPGAHAARTACGIVAPGHQATAALRVRGGQMQDTSGHRFIPYGISIVGGPETAQWRTSERSAAAQIAAAAAAWHVNVLRLQVSEAELLKPSSKGAAYNVQFAQSVDRLVCAILNAHAIPVINDNTLFTGNSKGPTRTTVEFWRFMARRYGNLPVIFDLFNEPRVTRALPANTVLSPATIWRVWQSGGVVNGIRYYGMQDLVHAIRVTEKAHNVIWADTAYKGAETRPLPHHLLKGGNIVYAFHKGLTIRGSAWTQQIETLVRKRIPVVNGEWTQFAATDRPWMCDPGGYRSVPQYLALLRRLSIGLVAWSLQPGSLVEGTPGVNTVHDGAWPDYPTDPRALETPSVMTPTYGCDVASRGQGAGALVMQQFKQLSRKPPATLFPVFS